MAGKKISFGTAAKRIERLVPNTLKESPSGLRLIGEQIMTDVKLSRPGAGVPKKTGALAGSGVVKGPIQRGEQRVVLLTFGGPAAPYALIQHERVDFHHTLGEARYLIRGAERFKKHGLQQVKRAMAQVAEAAVKASRSVR